MEDFITFRMVEGESLQIREMANRLDAKHMIPKSKRSVIAQHGEEVLGICASWDNPTHPHREYVSVVVAPEHRRQGIGTAMFSHLYGEKHLPLQTAFASTNREAASFADKLGFCKARETYTFWCKGKRRCVKENPTLKTAGETVAVLSQTEREEFYRLAQEDYARKHAGVNPLNPAYSLDEFAELLEDDMVENASYVARTNECLCYMFVYEDDGRDETAQGSAFENASNQVEYPRRSVLIGYTGFSPVSGIKNEHAANGYRLFLESALHKLVERFDWIALEADDCDEDAMLLSQYFDFCDEETWIAYTLTP